MKITKVSTLTGVQHTMDIPMNEQQAREYSIPWPRRRHIQDIFPELDADKREFLMSGITPEEWDEAFGNEEDITDNI